MLCLGLTWVDSLHCAVAFQIHQFPTTHLHAARLVMLDCAPVRWQCCMRPRTARCTSIKLNKHGRLAKAWQLLITPNASVVQDADLAPLRERREWLDVLGRLKGGVSDSTLVQLVRQDSPFLTAPAAARDREHKHDHASEAVCYSTSSLSPQCPCAAAYWGKCGR